MLRVWIQYKELTASTNDSDVDPSLMVSFSKSSTIVEAGSVLSTFTLITVCSDGGTMPPLKLASSTGAGVLVTGGRR